MITEDDFDIHHILGDPLDLLQGLALIRLHFIGEGDLRGAVVVLNLNFFVLRLLSGRSIWFDYHLIG